MNKVAIKLIASAAFLAVGLVGSAFAQSSHNAKGLSTAQTHVTNPTASSVLGTINGGTPGRGFGQSVGGAASTQGNTSSGGIGGPGGTHHGHP